MRPLRDQQRHVARSMAAALLLSIVVLGCTAWLQPLSSTHALQWLILLPLPLLLSIAALARHRFFSAQDIDGSALAAGSAAAVRLQAIIQNTLEQTVLALLVYLGWINTAPIDRLGMIPAAVLLFLIGRILFARGYSSGAAARAFGFALTFYPTVILCLLGIGHWLYEAAR